MKMKLCFVLLSILSLASCGNNGTSNTPSVTYTVSGAISPPLAGVTVQLTNNMSTASTITKIDGSYSFSGVENGVYVVKPNYAGYKFNPDDRSITINRKCFSFNRRRHYCRLRPHVRISIKITAVTQSYY